jgi:DNA adenine methylase
LKTPLTYYGGKQQLADKIIKLIPDHELYCEPFLGGGAVFFRKEKSKVEIINDTNRELVNFYKVAQQDFVSLEKEIMITLHSRDQHRKAQVIYNNPDMFSEVKRAWALWTLATESFGAMLDGSFGYDRSGTTTKKISNKRESFSYEYAIRLQNVQIECTDALRIIRSRDTEDTFFYCDPPYYNSDCGHYDGYTEEDFIMLLDLLTEIKGKFLLSSYPSEVLKAFTAKSNWSVQTHEMMLCMGTSQGQKKKKKTEVFTANYPI